MIVHDFVDVECPADEVTRALVAGGAWLAECASSAHASAEHLRVRVGPAGPRSAIAKTVDLQLGTPVVLHRVTIIPVLWEATGAPELFPRLDGSIEISPFGDNLTQVTLFARYDPPFGKVGEVIDHLMFHHLAEHTVRAFLQDLAARLCPSGSSDRHGAPASVEVHR